MGNKGKLMIQCDSRCNRPDYTTG